MGKDDTYRHILKYTGIFGSVQGMNILVSLVRNKLVALILGPGGMGLNSLFNTTVNLMSQTTGLGIGTSAVRNISELYEKGDTTALEHSVKMVRAWSLLTALAGMLLCMILGPALNNFTFSWGNHSLHFILLSPAVALIAITGGETAILKGIRKLRALAVMQIYNMAASLVVSIPIYYVWGESGIVPVIVMTALIAMLLVIWQSYKVFPLRLSGSFEVLGEGMGMIRLGVAFMVAGIFGSGVELFVRSWLNVNADLNTVGLYNAGYMITITYAGMVFSAMETDYFPRLTAVNHDNTAISQLANKQIEVSLLIVSPMLVALIILLPVLIPLLFSSKFLPVVSMTQVAVLAMFFRAIMLPVEYIPLAKGESMTHLGIEAIYSIITVPFIIYGYENWELLGTGIGLVASYALNFIAVLTFAFWRYGYTMSRQVILYSLIQMPLVIVAYTMTFIDNSIAYWLSGTFIVLVSAAFSLYVIQRKTALWKRLF